MLVRLKIKMRESSLQHRICFYVLITTVLALISPAHAGADWPTYRADIRRSGVTNESLPQQLCLHWVHQSRQLPHSAWSKYDNRMYFDSVYHTVISAGTVLYGSSADDKVYALDAATGAEKWTFYTDGPVRFAPTIWKNRAYVVSDDGMLYCLAVADGSCHWKLQGGPTRSMLLGNGRMISRWPARGGPLVIDGVVYFAAGIWPSEGIFVYALDALTGEILWVNDSSGQLVLEQPHAYNRARSGMSAQGYLAAGGRRLFVPTGRAVPAVFNRSEGTLLYYRLGLGANQRTGGADIVVDDMTLLGSGGVFYNNGRVFRAEDGHPLRWLQSQQPTMSRPASFPNTIVLMPTGVCLWDDGKLKEWQWAETTRKDEQGKTHVVKDLREVWSVQLGFGGTALIKAGNSLVSGGNQTADTGVSIMDLGSEEMVWSAQVEGIPYGLAVADQRLYVSTTTGAIYCFGAGSQLAPKIITSSVEAVGHQNNDLYEKACDEIIRKTEISSGYCVDLGCGEGGLTYALAQKTNLHIIAIEQDAAKVARARKRLDAAGLYGSRVSVLQDDPRRTQFPKYIANLIVSGNSLTEGIELISVKETERLLRPSGGTSIFGPAGAMQMNRRGALEQAGQWTHQYADAANTLASEERLVNSPLVMHWFTDFKYQMANRHGRLPAPLCKNGIMVIVGLHGVYAVDAYNGHEIWQYEIRDLAALYDKDEGFGVSATNSFICMGDDSVYVRNADRCLRLALATGRKIQEYSVPRDSDPKTGSWGYVAWADETLYGSRNEENYILMEQHGKYSGVMDELYAESDMLFALDVKTGKRKWIYHPRHSIRNNAIAIGAGRVYLIDRPVAEIDVYKAKRGNKPVGHPYGALVALNAADGQCLWSCDKDIYGTMLALSLKHDVLLMSYQLDQRHAYQWSELGGRMSGFRASDGARLWDANCDYVARPLIIDRWIYAQPVCLDLLTGKVSDAIQVKGRQGGACGIIAGCQNMLLYRSGTIGYTDLRHNMGTESYGGVRPACWINTIPAGGLVLMPDFTYPCTCSYLMKASIALEPGLQAPVIVPGTATFSESVMVKMTTAQPDVEIRYSLDGTLPTSASIRYTEPFTLDRSTTIQARTFANGLPPSPVRTAYLKSSSNQTQRQQLWTAFMEKIRADENLVALYDFEETQGTVLHNRCPASGKTNGTLESNGGTLPMWAPGRWLDKTALVFDGSGQYVTCGKDSFDLEGPLTIMVWVRLRSNDPAHILSNVEDGGYCLKTNGDQFIFSAYIAGEYREAVGSQSYRPESWFHVAGVYDGSEVKVFVNGKLDGKAPPVPPAAIKPSKTPLTFAANPTPAANQNTEFLNGLIDEAMIFKRALSAEQIREIYQAGVCLSAPPADGSIIEETK